MEKEKTFNKPRQSKTVFKPNNISTHLLYKRLSHLRTDQAHKEKSLNTQNSVQISNSQSNNTMENSKKNNDDIYNNFRITNKKQKETESWTNFKEENVKKLELWEKFQVVKEKMNISSTSLTGPKNFLSKLIYGTQIPKKLLRDFGRFDVKTSHSSRKTINGNTQNNHNNEKSQLNSPKLTTNSFLELHTNYKKIEAFSSVKPNGRPETNQESIRNFKFYSQDQILGEDNIDGKHLKSTISVFDEKKDDKNDDLRKTLNEKFKKSIRNIFVKKYDLEREKNKRINGKNKEPESFDFFNVSSKTIYNKLI